MIFPFVGKLVAFFVTPATPDLAHDFHFRELTIRERVYPEYLYARFAWNVFKMSHETLGHFSTPPEKSGKNKRKRKEIGEKMDRIFRFIASCTRVPAPIC